MESQHFAAKTNERRQAVEKLELKFSYEKPTKNTVRYREEAHSSRDIAAVHKRFFAVGWPDE